MATYSGLVMVYAEQATPLEGIVRQPALLPAPISVGEAMPAGASGASYPTVPVGSRLLTIQGGRYVAVTPA